MYGNPMGGSPLFQWLSSPLTRWHMASVGHKVFSAAAGAGVAYYAHTRLGWEPWKVAAAGLGTAYGSSMVLHTVSGMGLTPQALPQANTAALPVAPPMGAVPPMPATRPEQPRQPDNVVELRPEERRAAKAAPPPPPPKEYSVPSNLNSATVPPPPPPPAGTGTTG